VKGLVLKKGVWKVTEKLPDMPSDMNFSSYKQGAVDLFTNKNAASFVSNVDGRLYKFDPITGYFGVANPKTGVIITFFKPDRGVNYWIEKIAEHVNGK